MCSWRGGSGLVVGSAGESMKGRDHEIETWRDGETAMRGDVGGAEALIRAETRVPTSLLQREKDRKRGWGVGETEGFGGAGGEGVLVA